MKKMKWIMAAAMCIAFLLPARKADAQILDLINAAIVKAIMAVDLKVQQVQTKTIWLQNAEAELENKMSLGHLNDISGWLQKEKDLYANYYQELQSVRQVIADYDEVKRIIRQQTLLVSEYQSAYALFKQDRHFTPDELNYMAQVYNGILEQSVANLNEVRMAINSFQTQMTDAQRLALIHKARNRVQTNLDDLRQFNRNSIQLSLKRAEQQNDAQSVRTLYGL